MINPIKIGTYWVSITGSDTPNYCNVFIIDRKDNCSDYVDLAKDEKFKELLKLGNNNYPTPETDLVSYREYVSRRDTMMGKAQPVWLLSIINLKKLLGMLDNSKDNPGASV